MWVHPKIYKGNFLTKMSIYFEIEKPSIPSREKDSHKGTFGTALHICGSVGFAGAAVLAGRACLKSGVGLLKVLVPKGIYNICAKSLPEAVFIVSKRGIKEQIKNADSVLIGPGMSVSKRTKTLLKKVLENATSPIIIDADGINVLSRGIDMLKRAKTPIILTPHPKEMSRLTGLEVNEIQKNRETVAKDFAQKYGVYLVLKGSGTVVATPTGDAFINPTGNPGMATGGSGDVLSGIISALVCYFDNITDAIKSAVYIHGMAGDVAANRLSQTALLPSDIIEELPCVFKTLEG